MEKSFVFKFMGLNFDLTGIIGSTLMALAVFLICLWLARKVEMKPNKRQNVLEYLLEFTNGIVKDNVSDVDAQTTCLVCFCIVPFHLVLNQLGMFLEVKVMIAVEITNCRSSSDNVVCNDDLASIVHIRRTKIWCWRLFKELYAASWFYAPN